MKTDFKKNLIEACTEIELKSLLETYDGMDEAYEKR